MNASSTALPPHRYLELVRADSARLASLAEQDRKLPVPSCPGWDVAEVAWHTAVVFEHKVRVMADNGWPDPWPPDDFDERDEVEFLREATDHLVEEFGRHDADETTTTFGADNTIGFWLRRMALEAAVHRYDAELAHAQPTPIPDDLATDGIDELLRVMLAGPWWDGRVDTQHPVEAPVAVEAAGRRWLCDVRRRSVSVVSDDQAPATATVSGSPMAVFLWLWGRGDDATIEVAGDADVAREFRARIAECSQ